MTREKSPEQPELPEPPDHLTTDSKALWRAVVQVMAEHTDVMGSTQWIVPSPGRLALLTTGLEARDRATQARLAIAKDGLTTTTETTKAVHAHPLLKVEQQSQAIFARCWGSLKLDWHSRIDGGESW